MIALITGASSGIGRDMARILSNMGYDLILVARRKERMEALAKELKTKTEIIATDISIEENCFNLYKQVKEKDIEILINNAGFGVFGRFLDTDTEKEMNMINLNIKAVHILTKLFLKDFKEKDRGYILNVGSSASFCAGPLLSGYYASKNYVLRLTEAIYEELRREKSKVYVGVLCPGPVDTEFNDVANVKFSIKAFKSNDVANYAIKQMFKKKFIISPGILMKVTRFFCKITPERVLLKACYNIQKGKEK